MDFILYDRLEVIRKTINKYGEENFYISFSGGKDSTVLHYLIDEALPSNKIPRVFINTGIEYNYIREFVYSMKEKDERFIIINSGVNIKRNEIKLCKLYYAPFNFKRTGCKGCPYSINIQSQLDIMEKYLPDEKRQCEAIWGPVYDEYRRIKYRLIK